MDKGYLWKPYLGKDGYTVFELCDWVLDDSDFNFKKRTKRKK